MIQYKLAARLGALTARVIQNLRDGTATPTDAVLDQLAALEAEVALAYRAIADPSELEEVGAGLAALREILTNPATLAQMVEALAHPRHVKPALIEAIREGDADSVRALLPGYAINSQHGAFRTSALYEAMSAMFGVSVEIIDLLLDAGADPQIGIGERNVLQGLGFGRCEGIAPEDLARVIRRCVVLGADLEQRSEVLGWTPLMTAASEGNAVAVEALLLAGADIAAEADTRAGVVGPRQDSFFHAGGSAETLAVLARYARSS